MFQDYFREINNDDLFKWAFLDSVLNKISKSIIALQIKWS
jgi:hypothetical protein